LPLTRVEETQRRSRFGPPARPSMMMMMMMMMLMMLMIVMQLMSVRLVCSRRPTSQQLAQGIRSVDQEQNSFFSKGKKNDFFSFFFFFFRCFSFLL
jgi:hypothetical protein